MKSALYVVGVPIGNMKDITFRAVEVLRAVDFIAAEDMSVSRTMLKVFNIEKPMVSYYQHGESGQREAILNRIQMGESCAVITDAGMPCISDPGENLVRMCSNADIDVVVVPGPSAVVSALAVSGLDTGRFSFEGFLSVNRNKRYEHLASLTTYPNTMIFYEANRKLRSTLADIRDCFGDRRIAIVHDMTKGTESIVRTTLNKAASMYGDKRPKGEYVLVIEGMEPYRVRKDDVCEA